MHVHDNEKESEENIRDYFVTKKRTKLKGKKKELT